MSDTSALVEELHDRLLGLTQANRDECLKLVTDALEAKDRALAEAVASAGVKVKALEWQRSAKGCFFARTLWGTYSVERHGDAWAWSCHWRGTTAAMLHPCATEEEGMASAQADHDSYIRAALEGRSDG